MYVFILIKKGVLIILLRAMLPSYRPAPDYETAIQHKYRGHPVLYSSQPEIHQGHLQEVNHLF